MFRFIRWLITGDGHRHEWETIARVQVHDHDGGERPVGCCYHLQCKHCGNVKEKNIDY